MVVNIAGLNIGWFACVLGAAAGYPLVGPAVVAVLVGLHLVLAPYWRREAVLILLVGMLGTAADSIQMAAGTLGFPNTAGSAWLVPFWMIALWLNFATGLTVALHFLIGRTILASLLGLLGGSSAYYSGAKLGALSFPNGHWQGAALVGLAWAILLPLMARLTGAMHVADSDATAQSLDGLTQQKGRG